MRALIYDTETTGLPDWKQPSELPHQPHLVEISALLYDVDTRELIESMHAIVRPNGWEIPAETVEVHGITTERALAEGISEPEALAEFMALHAKADVRVAHNESFDARLLRIAIKRYGDGKQDWERFTQQARDEIADAFKERPAYCTCNNAKPIIKLPATAAMKRSGKGHWFKPPNLQEAHQFFLGEGFEGAHSATADAEACARVYFALLDRVKAAA